MNFKKLFSASITVAAFGLTNAQAEVDFSPSVEAGARSVLSGQLSGGEGSSSIGPYVTPAFDLSFGNDKVSLSTWYAVEISGAEGFGANKQDIGESLYFYHNPGFMISGGVSPNWKLNLLGDFVFHHFNGNDAQGNNYHVAYVNPDVTHKFNDRFSLALGYVLHRSANIDSVIEQQKGADGSILAAVTPGVGQEPVSTLHAGIATAKIKVADGVSLKTYVRAGKKIANKAAEPAYAYRFNADLSTKTPVKNLKLKLRYRLNLEDVSASQNKWYNLGRIIATYGMGDNWDLTMTNTFSVSQSSKSGSNASYENENYIGAKFKF